MDEIALRQLDLCSASESDRGLFDLAFPEFAKREEGRGRLTILPPLATKGEGPGSYYLLTSADEALLHEISKPRRFSGGTGLGRSRYYAVVGSQESTSDDGTLIAEIQEYWDLDAIFHTGYVSLFDQGMACDRGKLVEFGIKANGDPSSLLCIFLPLHAGHLTEAARLAGRDEPATVILGFRVQTTRVPSEGVVDLRRLEGQEEFLELIRSSAFLRAKLVDLDGPNAFARTLPALMAGQRGGTIFHQYVGHALRRRGARGLVYPSARCDSATELVDGQLRRWTGWCFVDYLGVPPSEPTMLETLPAYLESYWTAPHFSDVAHIQVTADPAYRGSFYVTGIEADRWSLFSAVIQNARGLVGRILESESGHRSFSPGESKEMSAGLRERVGDQWRAARSNHV